MPQKIMSIANTEQGLVGLDCDGLTLWLFKAEVIEEQPTGKYTWVKLQQTQTS